MCGGELLGDATTKPIRPPSRIALLGEVRISVEWTTMRLMLPILRRTVPQGNGEPLMIVPGFASDDTWTESLRRFLGDVGWDAHGWGLGRNTGRVPKLIPQLVDRTQALADTAGRRVRLVGWSLGGYLVREVGRERPEVVERIVTLGAPVVGGPTYTASAPMYVKRGYDLEAIAAEVENREVESIQVPIDAIVSRSDGIVAWRACIDHRSPHVRHHEVRSSHLGLVASPRVYRLLAELLGEEA
jgi:pimeloyl-ACP methyl ester carboxylesterase